MIFNFDKSITSCMLFLSLWISAECAAQDRVADMDHEPHYSLVFSNEYCRAYIMSLDGLEQSKPVVHERDWVRMTLGGSVEEARGGATTFRKVYEDPDGHEVSFLRPINSVILRNRTNAPYRSLIVEIMQADDSKLGDRDPSEDLWKNRPVFDSHISFVACLPQHHLRYATCI
jgi:hypothetical protein